MVASLLSLATVALGVASTVTAAPADKRQWGDWQRCTPEKMTTRVDFATMAPADRKAYTDAINCIISKPSNLDKTKYPGAINRFNDYSAVHINRTQSVHISGFFLTWHRYYLHLFEKDLRETCGYKGAFPYWNFAETATDIINNPVFDGSAYSMSGDGAPNNTGPIPLGPNFTIPHGAGGGCVTNGPFANLVTPFAFIDPSALLTGALPPTAFDYSPSCLIRDLNQYVATMYTNTSEVSNTVHSPSAAALELNMNGVIGSPSLGIHSGAHFEVGGDQGPMGSIHVSPQDPIWYPLHTFIDHIYTSWQINNPDIASQLYGTETAVNIPPSPNVTLSTIEPDWGYFDESAIPVSELISTTAGPFCYQYDSVLT